MWQAIREIAVSQVVCRGGCGRQAPRSSVQARNTFEPARDGSPATWLCRECRGQAGKVTMKCPVPGCATGPRREYKSARWKLEHSQQLHSDGYYAIPCRPHNLKLQGRLQTGRMREVLFKRFRAWFTRTTYVHGEHTAREVWDYAIDADAEPETRIECQKIIRLWRSTAAAEMRRRKRADSGRGRRGAKGGLLRWANTKGQAFARCRLCWTLLDTKVSANARRRQRLHGGKGFCWDTWRRTPEYRGAWKRRRWDGGGPANDAPIDPPIPPWVGRLATSQGISRKYEWFIKNRVLRESMKSLAKQAGVTLPAVTQGIHDFIHWLPGDLGLVFSRSESRAEIQRALGPTRMPADVQRRRDDIQRIFWLGDRWSMAPDAIARLVVGYSSRAVARVLKMRLAASPA
jgi:hypothetical protein